MLMKDIKWNDLEKEHGSIIAIMQNGKCVAEGFIGDVLKSIPHLANSKIIDQRSYFEEWVIEVK